MPAYRVYCLQRYQQSITDNREASDGINRVTSVREEFDFLSALINGFAEHWGSKCEVVLHDLKDQPYDRSIVAIVNGDVTGRKVGDCGTNLGLEILRGTERGGDQYNYVTQTKEGKVLRSTSIYIRDPEGKVIGAICINFDITDLLMAEQALASITNHSLFVDEEKRVDEVFASDVNELLDTLIQQSFQHVKKPVAHMNKEDKLRGIQFLDERGAFLIKKSVDRVAKFYDISKFTIYNYLDQARSRREADTSGELQ